MSNFLPSLYLLNVYENTELIEATKEVGLKMRQGFTTHLIPFDVGLCLIVEAIDTKEGLCPFGGYYEYSLDILLDEKPLKQFIDRGNIKADYFVGPQEVWKELEGISNI